MTDSSGFLFPSLAEASPTPTVWSVMGDVLIGFLPGVGNNSLDELNVGELR